MITPLISNDIKNTCKVKNCVLMCYLLGINLKTFGNSLKSKIGVKYKNKMVMLITK